nr:hypothetical protein [uncultured Rhodopila sp.]
MMDLLLLAYFALPATVTLIAFVGLKLHERSAPAFPTEPERASTIDEYSAFLDWYSGRTDAETELMRQEAAEATPKAE